MLERARLNTYEAQGRPPAQSGKLITGYPPPLFCKFGSVKRMSFEYNEKFMEYLEQVLKQPAKETITREYRRAVTPRDGIRAKAWRWWHRQCVKTHSAFWVNGWDKLAETVEPRGWRIQEYPAGKWTTANYLFREIAVGLQHEIGQLNENTGIQPQARSSQPIYRVRSQPQSMEMFDANKPVSEYVAVIPMNTYEIEWQQFAVSQSSEHGYNLYDSYYFAVAYDAHNDTLYVDYRS